MRRLLLLLVPLALAMPAAADDKKDEKWIQLFNGKDLTGWKLFPKCNTDFAEIITKMDGDVVTGFDAKLKKDGSTVHLWRVEDGMILGGGPHSHLFTERGDFTNFVFRVEAMINDHGNSGQFFRTAFGPDFPKGYEAQIDATHGDPIRTGSLYPSFKVSKEDRAKICVMNDAPHKPDEWFTQEVTAIDGKITIKVNGKTTVDWEDPNKTYLKGHMALQGHDPGTKVKFRKIEVMEIK